MRANGRLRLVDSSARIHIAFFTVVRRSLLIFMLLLLLLLLMLLLLLLLLLVVGVLLPMFLLLVYYVRCFPPAYHIYYITQGCGHDKTDVDGTHEGSPEGHGGGHHARRQVGIYIYIYI